MKTITLICCCCGGEAPALEQWWNRDTGYGLCGACAARIQASGKEPEFELTYGVEGKHWFAIPPKPKPLDREYLKLAAKEISARLPDNHGFILLAVPFGEQPDKRLTYISSLKREDAIIVLKEFLLNAGAAEDWMQHIK